MVRAADRSAYQQSGRLKDYKEAEKQTDIEADGQAEKQTRRKGYRQIGKVENQTGW